MTQRISPVVGGLVIALLIALLALAGAVGMLLTRPAQAQPVAGSPRQITVVGVGEVQGTPDTANVQIGVETEAPTTQEALDQNNAQVQAIIAKMKELGVDEKDIQTRNFNIYPRYDNEGRQVRGYQVSNIVAVTIRNLDEAGALLDQVVQEGANRVYGISFSVDDPSELIAQARDAAVAEARAKAEQLAGGADASVGQALVITENVGSQQPIPVAFAVGEADRAVPIEAGEQTFTAQVQITFELR